MLADILARGGFVGLSWTRIGSETLVIARLLLILVTDLQLDRLLMSK
jgi:hypothetical protein